jgi:hypothetical protein
MLGVLARCARTKAPASSLSNDGPAGSPSARTASAVPPVSAPTPASPAAAAPAATTLLSTTPPAAIVSSPSTVSTFGLTSKPSTEPGTPPAAPGSITAPSAIAKRLISAVDGAAASPQSKKSSGTRRTKQRLSDTPKSAKYVQFALLFSVYPELTAILVQSLLGGRIRTSAPRCYVLR